MSRFEDALAAGRFVVTSELLTVDSGGLDAVHERFAPFADYVDATNATDNTSAHAHASPLAVAIALKQLGMEPIMQLTCRDRNRLALEADLAGAALHGVQNVLCLTQINRFFGLAGHSHDAPSVHTRDCIGPSEVFRELIREVVRLTVLSDDSRSPLNGDIQVGHS